MFGVGKEEKHSQNSSKAINKIYVRAKLAETAGVSTDTYSKGAKILNSDNEKLKQEVLSGEKSINAGYKELTGKKENQYIQAFPNLGTLHNGNNILFCNRFPKRKRSYSSQKYYNSHSMNKKQPYTLKERNQ